MRILSVIFFGSLFLTSLQVQARKPAVEEFIGVETQYYQDIEPGNEVYFNFSDKMPEKTDQPGPVFSLFVLFAFMSLPLALWFAITRENKDHNHQLSEKSFSHGNNNIIELSSKMPRNDDDVKKAS